MAPISLKIVLEDGAVTRKVKFDSADTVQLAHQVVKEKVLNADDSKEYGLFLRSADNDFSGVWLENNRTLDYYMLRDGDSLDYICKIRNLRVRLLDGTVKTLQVDQAKSISDVMMGICGKIGITNWDEYGLCHEEEEASSSLEDKPQQNTGTLTLKRKAKDRDVQLEQLSKKIKTDDNVQWLDQHKTLRETALDPKQTLLLKRRLFYSDRNVDARDPVQLNLLYVQTRDAILNGTHPVTEDQAADCKVRWINIRDVNRRIMKKNLLHGKIIRRYKYEEELSFMKPFYRDVVVQEVYASEKEDDWNDCNDNTEPQCDNEPTSHSEEFEEVHKEVKPKKRRKSKKKYEKSFVEQEKPSTSNSESLIQDYDPTDPVDAFLLSIGATLKTFSPYHLNLAKSEIFSVVQKHDLQQIVQKGNTETKVLTSESMFLHE